jgi:cytochrome c5
MRNIMKTLLAAAICLLAFSNAQAAQDPEAVFNRACTACHSGQLPMAPKKGDQAAWKPRLAQGEEVLIKHVTEGFNAMPARGLCMDCSAEDYKAVIGWMSK